MLMRKSKALVVMLTAAMLLVGVLGGAASGEIPSGPNQDRFRRADVGHGNFTGPRCRH